VRIVTGQWRHLDPRATGDEMVGLAGTVSADLTTYAGLIRNPGVLGVHRPL
jgi:hypothetical protein